MKKLKTFKLDITINTSKEETWDLLFNRFGEVNNFNPLIEGSHHTTGQKGKIGCERQCDINSKNSIHEKIVAANGTDDFDIDIIKGGLPMMDEMKANFAVEELHGKTKVTATIRFNTKPAFIAVIMKGMMAKMFFKMLIGLKFHLETEGIVTKKNIKQIEKEYKKLTPNQGFASGLKMIIA